MSAKIKISMGNVSQVVPDDGLPLEHLPHHDELLLAYRLRDNLPARPEDAYVLRRVLPSSLSQLMLLRYYRVEKNGARARASLRLPGTGERERRGNTEPFEGLFSRPDTQWQ